MPTFDFQCRACDHVFEFSRPFGNTVKPACPACTSKRTEKLLAPPAVHFKGSGWYKTDSRGGARSAPVDATSSPKKEEKISEGAKTEAKPVESNTTEKKTKSAETSTSPLTNNKPK
ncbi:zinc ribbon domain-containing protein [Candidatus Peribacteria bacterium]|nr:zinc ribbon domain-containing protein [Candidatus Peribacteria bacterium]